MLWNTRKGKRNIPFRVSEVNEYKPSACLGCPLYGDGRGFVADELRQQAPVFILGQNPGEEEVEQGTPFVGKTGRVMESKYLKDAGLTRESVSIGNAIRCRWKHSNELPEITTTLAKDALTYCTQAHLTVPEGTRLIVAQGDYAAQVTTGEPLKEWRGYVRPFIQRQPEVFTEPWVPGPRDLPVLVTVHLARLFREPYLILPTRRDWTKIPRLLRGTWPRKPPRFMEIAPDPWPNMFTFDTEFYARTYEEAERPHLVRYSMSWGLGDDETCVIERPNHVTPSLTARSRVVTQYAPADVEHLEDLIVSDPWNAFLLEDTVWKHATLWSDHPHDLNYLGSVYSSFNRWKHLGGSDPVLYAGLDSLGLLEVDQALERELDADPRSRHVWETIDRPALREFVQAQYTGLRMNPTRIKEVSQQLRHEVVEAGKKARAIVGWPINLASNPQVAHRLYTVEGIKVPRGG